VNLVAAAVLAAGVRLVDAVLPGPRTDGAGARAADDPGEVRDRLVRAAALGAVLLVAGWAGRTVGGRDRRGRRPGRRRTR
jgi:hypothetical protein